MKLTVSDELVAVATRANTPRKFSAAMSELSADGWAAWTRALSPREDWWTDDLVAKRMFLLFVAAENDYAVEE